MHKEKPNKKPVTLPASAERNRILGIEQVAEITNYSIPHIRRLYRTGKFPAPLVIGARKKGWPLGTILDLTTLKEAV